MRISKRTREQAALICAIAASGGVLVNEDEESPEWSSAMSDVADALDATQAALELALDAWSYVANASTVGLFEFPYDTDAEAESLLRTGWCPDE